MANSGYDPGIAGIAVIGNELQTSPGIRPVFLFRTGSLMPDLAQRLNDRQYISPQEFHDSATRPDAATGELVEIVGAEGYVGKVDHLLNFARREGMIVVTPPARLEDRVPAGFQASHPLAYGIAEGYKRIFG